MDDLAKIAGAMILYMAVALTAIWIAAQILPALPEWIWWVALAATVITWTHRRAEEQGRQNERNRR